MLELAQWFLGKAGDELFGLVKRRLLEVAGQQPSVDAERTQLLDDYSRLVTERLSGKIIYRLDEDRLSALSGGLAQLRAASQTQLRREYLAGAATTFFALASLPERGRTAGIDNRQIKSVATLGIAAVHVSLDEQLDDVAERVATAIRLDPTMARRWLGDDLFARLEAAYPTGSDEASMSVVNSGEPQVALAQVPPDARRLLVKEAIQNRSTGVVKLTGTPLDDADLSGLDLRYLDLTGANLSSADLSSALLGGAGFFGTHAVLSRADLTGALLTGAVAPYVDFRQAVLAKVVGDGADLDHANLNEAIMTESSFRQANLRAASCVKADLSGADLSAAVLLKTDLTGATLSGASLAGSTANGALLVGVRASELDLSSADLSKAQLVNAVLTGAQCVGTTLSRALLQSCDLEDADLSGADLSSAKVIDVDLRRVNLSGANLRGLRYRGNTVWPTGMVPVALGAVADPYI